MTTISPKLTQSAGNLLKTAMRNPRFIKPFFLLALLTTLVACNSDSNPTVTPSAGRLTGKVQLWDDKTSTLSDNSGVTISIDDLTSTTAVTDASGTYTFENLPYDVHNLTVTKSGYGTYRLFGVSHVASTTTTVGTVVPNIQLGRQSTTSVSSFSYVGSTYNGGPGVSFSRTLSPAPSSSNRGFVRYFLSTSPTVSSTSYQYVTPVLSAISNGLSGFSKDDLLNWGFTSGQTVYARIYGDSFQSNTYTDPNTNVRVFPNLNPTTPAAISFVVP